MKAWHHQILGVAKGAAATAKLLDFGKKNWKQGERKEKEEGGGRWQQHPSQEERGREKWQGEKMIFIFGNRRLFSTQNENILPPPIPAIWWQKNLFCPHAGDLRRERERTAALDHHQRLASPTYQYLTGDGGSCFLRQRSSQPALRINSRYFFFCLIFFVFCRQLLQKNIYRFKKFWYILSETRPKNAKWVLGRHHSISLPLSSSFPSFYGRLLLLRSHIQDLSPPSSLRIEVGAAFTDAKLWHHYGVWEYCLSWWNDTPPALLPKPKLTVSVVGGVE